MKTITSFAFLAVTFLSIVSSAQTLPDKGKAPPVDMQAWRGHMQALSAALTDGFPFFYSPAEYRSKENREAILRHLETLRSKAHSLPAKTGDTVQGNLPLGEGIQDSLKGQLGEAVDLFKRGQFEKSQDRLHQAIQTCFACHTTTVVGRQFPTANEEIMGVATSNVFGKAMVFGALRQFGGALDVIERHAKKSVKGKPEDDDLVRTHLVVSLRSQENFERALDFLRRWEASPVIGAWMKDIEAWDRMEEDSEVKVQQYIKQRKSKSLGAELFVVQLWETSILHPQAVQESSSTEKARRLDSLGQIYKATRFKPLVDLSLHYQKACAQLAQGTDKGVICSVE